MELKHNGSTYELVELKEPNSNEVFDIIAIFETCTNDENSWEIKTLVNYFYGANDTEKNLKKIALDYIKEYEQGKKTKTPQEKMFSRIKDIIRALGDENNENDTCELVEELENLLPFKNKKEHEQWITLTTTFKCWEEWEEQTIKIAKRLNRKDQ